jgi:hypothetical protein
MNDFRVQQRELIGCGLQRLRAASGALCVAAAMSGPSATAEDGESPRLQISPLDVVAAPETVPGASPPPPPLPELRVPMIRPGAASHSADATGAREIRIDPGDGTLRPLKPGLRQLALPVIAPNVALPAPAVLGGSIEIVPQEVPLERTLREAAQPAEPPEPQTVDPHAVQILPVPPRESGSVELPFPK